MNKYKTLEELKEELGTKFDDYMYKANIELLNKWNKLKEFAQELFDNPSWASCGARYILEKMQELEDGENND